MPTIGYRTTHGVRLCRTRDELPTKRRKYHRPRPECRLLAFLAAPKAIEMMNSGARRHAPSSTMNRADDLRRKQARSSRNVPQASHTRKTTWHDAASAAILMSLSAIDAPTGQFHVPTLLFSLSVIYRAYADGTLPMPFRRHEFHAYAGRPPPDHHALFRHAIPSPLP